MVKYGTCIHVTRFRLKFIVGKSIFYTIQTAKSQYCVTFSSLKLFRFSMISLCDSEKQSHFEHVFPELILLYSYLFIYCFICILIYYWHNKTIFPSVYSCFLYYSFFTFYPDDLLLPQQNSFEQIFPVYVV